MRQLMSQQMPPLLRPRREAAGIEYDVVSYRVGTGVDVARRLPGQIAGVHPHTAEIMAEARFEIVPRRRVERLASRAQRLVYTGGRFASTAFARPRRLSLTFFLLLASGAAAADLERRRRYGNLPARHLHHMVGDPVCFALSRIIDRADQD